LGEEKRKIGSPGSLLRAESNKKSKVGRNSREAGRRGDAREGRPGVYPTWFGLQNLNDSSSIKAGHGDPIFTELGQNTKKKKK